MQPLGTSERQIERLRQTASKAGEAALLAASHHPDHGPDAKAVFREALQRKGIGSDRIDAWMRASSDLTVPATVPAHWTASRYLRLAPHFKFWALLPRLGVATIVAVFSVLLARIYRPPNIVAFAALLALVVTPLILAFVPPFFGKRGARILLLRPFGQSKMTRALKRMVLRDLGPVGPVYTLSDRHYAPSRAWEIVERFVSPWLFLLRWIVAPLQRPSLRVATVYSEGSYFRLAADIALRKRVSYRCFVAGGQAL